MQKQYDAAYPEASATFMWWIGDTYAGNWGPERSRRLDPFQTFLKRGIVFGGGSDYPVTPFPARYGIWASIILSGSLRSASTVAIPTAVTRRSTCMRRCAGSLLRRAAALPREQGWLDRAGEVRRPRRVGSRSLHGADGGSQGDALPADVSRRPSRVPGGRGAFALAESTLGRSACGFGAGGVSFCFGHAMNRTPRHHPYRPSPRDDVAR